ncbi:hypothetical protein C2G38_2183613 [Gigaspora rosea]|uniref:Cytochrome P450 n=1 Tax=Gigaspora rosea TaxID=44941 RepID=A0A397VAU3_9GLOM|nr:hypothetical protein C2G38_2183613 [Gigaspora rosea]
MFPPNTLFDWKYDDLLKLEYCDSVINEVGQIIPISNEVPRYADNSYHWPNPEIFDPNRFYKNKLRHKFSLVTFGGGLRICPGRAHQESDMESKKLSHTPEA